MRLNHAGFFKPVLMFGKPEVKMANWQARYETLKRYIADHPTIEITANSTSIPGDVRPGFYAIFDDILAEYVRELYAPQLGEASLAISKFSEAKARLASLVGLKIEVNPNLGFFLADPVAGLTRSTFTLLLSLVRNNITVEDFERESDKIIQDSYPGFMREIYLQWSTLSLITLLGPDQVYSVPVPDETNDSHYTESELRPGNFEDIPQVVPAEKMMLYGSHYVAEIAPKLVFHSNRLNKYVAIRTDYHKVFCLVRKLHEIIKGLEWYQLKDIVNKFGVFNLWPDIGLYLDDNPEQLRILMTYTEALRPDMVLDVWNSDGQDVENGLEMARRHCNILLPRKEMFVISRASVLKKKTAGAAPLDASNSEDLSGEPQLDIRVLEVGYDASGLEPVVACLAKAEALE